MRNVRLTLQEAQSIVGTYGITNLKGFGRVIVYAEFIDYEKNYVSLRLLQPIDDVIIVLAKFADIDGWTPYTGALPGGMGGQGFGQGQAFPSPWGGQGSPGGWGTWGY
jgi:hypothetical protein